MFYYAFMIMYLCLSPDAILCQMMTFVEALMASVLVRWRRNAFNLTIMNTLSIIFYKLKK